MNWFTNENIFVAGLAIWLIFLVTGNYQLKKIKQSTTEIVLAEAKKWSKINREINLAGFYTHIFPLWGEMVRTSAWFIPHKTEIFPIPARTELVKRRINFSEEWVGAYLNMNDFHVMCSPDVKEKIDHILGLRKKPAKPADGNS